MWFVALLSKIQDKEGKKNWCLDNALVDGSGSRRDLWWLLN